MSIKNQQAAIDKAIESFEEYIKEESEKSGERITSAILNIDPRADAIIKYHTFFEERVRYLLRLCLNEPDSKYLKTLKYDALVKWVSMLGLFNMASESGEANRILDPLKKINSLRNEISHEGLKISDSRYEKYLGVKSYLEILKYCSTLNGRISISIEIATIDPTMLWYLSFKKGPVVSRGILFDAIDDKVPKELLNRYLQLITKLTDERRKKIEEDSR